MRYLTAEQVVFIHDQETPGRPLLFPDRLDAAVAAPRQTYDGQELYPTIHLKAAAILRGIARGHPFEKGNKRCALNCTYAFYAFNGWRLTMSDTDLIHVIVDTILERWEVEKIAERLELGVEELPDPE